MINYWLKLTAVVLLVLVGIAFSTELKYNIPTKHKVSFEQAKVIYNNLASYSGLTVFGLPQLTLDPNTSVNAYANASEWKIAVHKGMLDYVQSEDELAAVLAHEIAHLLLEHERLNTPYSKDLSMIHEGNADKFATYLVLRAGYDVCKAKDLWIRLRDEMGDYEINSDHPNYSYRAWQFDFPQCGSK